MDVYAGDTGTIGCGLYAARDYRRGETVFTPTGTVIDHQTIFSIQFGWNRHLDPDDPYKYINHSCDPTVGVKINAAGLPYFVALRDLRAGEQVTFDYAMTEYTHYPRENPADEFDLTCHCGSPLCRGKLGYYSELSDAIKEKYRGFIADYLVAGNGHHPEQAGLVRAKLDVKVQ